MVGQTFYLVRASPRSHLGHLAPDKRLQSFNDAGMQRPPSLLQQATVGDLVRQGVLEGVLAFREEACLIEELGRLEVREATMQNLLRQFGNGLQQRQGYLDADDRRGLEQALLLRRQAVDACRQHYLHRGRHLDRGYRLGQAAGTRRTDERPRLQQGADALLQEEGIAGGAGNQELLQRHQAGVLAQQRLQEHLGTGGWQGIEPQLGVEGFIAPAVLVLRPIVDEQEEVGRGQAVHQAVDQGLRLGINPVQILKDQQQRLPLALTQQQTRQRGECALAPLGWVKLPKRTVVWEGFQQRQQRWQRVLQGFIECQHLPGDLGPNGARVIAVVHMTIALEQVHDGEIGRGFAVGHGRTLQHPPTLRVVRVDELIHQAGLPYPGLTDHRHYLPVSGPRTLQGLHQHREFGVAADKAREPAGRGRLQAPPDAAGADQLKDIERRCQALDRHGSQRRDLDIPLSQTQHRLGQQDRAWHGHLLHAGRQVGGLAHRRVVHLEVAADGADDDFPRIEPDADLHRHAVAALHLGSILLHRGLHDQGRIAGPHRVVLMRQGSAKQRHNAIAHDLIDRALIAMHGGHHAFQHRIEELPGFLRVTVSEEFHGALEIGKQHRDLFALAFQGTAGR